MGMSDRLETLAPYRPTGSIHDFRHDPIVYYMRMDRLVKIGTTTNLLQRVSAIMPQGVIAVEPGGRARERDRHSQFVALHSHYEWYWMREALWQHVLKLREAAFTTFGMSVEQWLKEHGVRDGNNFATDAEVSQ